MNKKYTDELAGFYTENFPILSLSNDDVFENYVDDQRSLLADCVWFQCASATKQADMLQKLNLLSCLAEDIKKVVIDKYGELDIRHISIGGSYLYKEKANDIDFNVIVTGRHFSYTDVFDIDAINRKLPTAVKKISLMIFGEDDFLSRTDTLDMIEVEDYIHTSLRMREGLVFPIRNVLIFGHMWKHRDLDIKNIKIRIKRQLFHAQLMLDGKVDLHRDTNARLSKSVGRITEAFLYLSVVFPELKIFSEHILQKEKELQKSLNYHDIVSWLNEANKNLVATNGFVLWLTGLSGAGKSTIGDCLSEALEGRGILTQRLDGNFVKGCFGDAVNFGEDDHDFNIKIAALIASVFEKQGVCVIASFVTPQKAQREFLRNYFGKYIEVYVNTPMDVCMKRDTKGLYKKALNGKIKYLPGISYIYEAPENPDLTMNASKIDSAKLVKEIINYLLEHKFIS